MLNENNNKVLFSNNLDIETIKLKLSNSNISEKMLSFSNINLKINEEYCVNFEAIKNSRIIVSLNFVKSEEALNAVISIKFNDMEVCNLKNFVLGENAYEEKLFLICKDSYNKISVVSSVDCKMKLEILGFINSIENNKFLIVKNNAVPIVLTVLNNVFSSFQSDTIDNLLLNYSVGKNNANFTFNNAVSYGYIFNKNNDKFEFNNFYYLTKNQAGYTVHNNNTSFFIHTGFVYDKVVLLNVNYENFSYLAIFVDENNNVKYCFTSETAGVDDVLKGDLKFKNNFGKIINFVPILYETFNEKYLYISFTNQNKELHYFKINIEDIIENEPISTAYVDKADYFNITFSNSNMIIFATKNNYVKKIVIDNFTKTKTEIKTYYNMQYGISFFGEDLLVNKNSLIKVN